MNVRHVSAASLVEPVAKAAKKACIELPKEVEENLELGLQRETSPLGKEILGQILENSRLARASKLPMCQDTGIVVAFLEVGREVVFDADPYDAINEGIRQAYTKGFLRKSIVKHPFDRVNTKDNTPAVIHTKIVDGDKVKIVLAPKGAGSENMSRLKMFSPSATMDDVKNFILETVTMGGGKPCPPLTVGIGIGGNFEMSAQMAKSAVLRDINDESEDPISRQLEIDLLTAMGASNVGPMGLGGSTTAIGVKVNVAPCHIASLPVAVNIQCHASRHQEVIV